MNNTKNFQKSNLKIKKCSGCEKKCNLLYDRHHDEHYSNTCGTVIYQSLQYQLEYTTDPYYWEKEYSKRREIKQIQKEKEEILKKLQFFKKKYTLDNNIINITNLKPTEEIKIIYLCKDTHYKLIKKNIITENGTLKKTQYQIQQKNPEEIKKMKKEKKEKEEKENEKQRIHGYYNNKNN